MRVHIMQFFQLSDINVEALHTRYERISFYCSETPNVSTIDMFTTNQGPRPSTGRKLFCLRAGCIYLEVIERRKASSGKLCSYKVVKQVLIVAKPLRQLRDSEDINAHSATVSFSRRTLCHRHGNLPISYSKRFHKFLTYLHSSEINPTRCNNSVYSSQWLYSTCFGRQLHPSSGVQCCIWPFRQAGILML